MVRTQEAWLSRIYVLYVKGSFKCLWPNFFNGSEIFNKVIYQLLLIQFVVIGQTMLFLLQCIMQFIGILLPNLTFYCTFVFPVFLQHTQGILFTSRYYITHLWSDWKIAPWRAWPSCNTTRHFIWSTTFWWGEISMPTILEILVKLLETGSVKWKKMVCTVYIITQVIMIRYQCHMSTSTWFYWGNVLS